MGKHLALVGFMGAGKTTIGREVARLTERPFVDVDAEIEKRHGPIADIFEKRGEAEFRGIEERVVMQALAPDPAVIALGGGALGSAVTRARLRETAFTVFLDVDPGVAWERVGGGDRPLARDEARFRRLYDERRPTYEEAADAVARDAEGVLLAALAIHVAPGCAHSVSGDAVIADETVLALYPSLIDAPVHAVPPGEEAKTLTVVERLYDELDVDRAGVVVAFGGGATTDVAGFVAATYLRGLRWAAVPTTVVGQVDAAIGGKTAINVGKGKNLVGAFHFPEHVAVDPTVVSTLPEREWRNGMAEVVKTGLLAGRPLWEADTEEMIRGCAAFKAAVVVSDPYEHGRRAILNLGHTFAHALETASDYRLSHGEAVALGLLAALRLSGVATDVVEEALQPRPVRVDRERAWAALQLDKKARDARIRLVLLDGPGKPVFPAELAEQDVRRALDALIAD